MPEGEIVIPNPMLGEDTPYCLIGTARAKAECADELESLSKMACLVASFLRSIPIG